MTSLCLTPLLLQSLLTMSFPASSPRLPSPPFHFTFCLLPFPALPYPIHTLILLGDKGTHTHTHIHPFYGPLSETTQVSRYQKGKTNVDFTEARDSEWQWHQLMGDMLQTDNHASTPPLSFLQAGCPVRYTDSSPQTLRTVSGAASSRVCRSPG